MTIKATNHKPCTAEILLRLHKALGRRVSLEQTVPRMEERIGTTPMTRLLKRMIMSELDRHSQLIPTQAFAVAPYCDEDQTTQHYR